MVEFTEKQIKKIKMIRDGIYFDDPDADIDVYVKKITEINEFKDVESEDIREIIFENEITDSETIEELEEEQTFKGSTKISEESYGKMLEEFEQIDQQIKEKRDDAVLNLMFREVRSSNMLNEIVERNEKIEDALNNTFSREHIIRIPVRDKNGREKHALHESTTTARDIFAFLSNINVETNVERLIWPDGSISFVGVATVVDLKNNKRFQTRTMKFYRQLFDETAEDPEERWIHNPRAFEMCQSTAFRKAILEFIPRKLIMRCLERFEKQFKKKR